MRSIAEKRDIIVAHTYEVVPGAPVPTYMIPPGMDKAIINPVKRHVRPYTLVTEPEVISIDPGETTLPIPLPIDNQGSSEIYYSYLQVNTDTAGVFTGEGANPAASIGLDALQILILDPGKRPFLMNRPIPVRHICSQFGGTPFIWPETLFLNVEDRGKALHVSFRLNKSFTNAISVRFSLHGIRYYHLEAPAEVQAEITRRYKRRFLSMPYFWTTDSDVVLGGIGSVVSRDIRITDEADAQIMKAMASSYSFPAGIPGNAGTFTVELLEKAVDRPLMSGPIHSSMFGNAEFPFIFFEDLFCEGNYQIKARFTSLTGQQYAFVTLAGRKIFHAKRRETNP